MPDPHFHVREEEKERQIKIGENHRETDARQERRSEAQ